MNKFYNLFCGIKSMAGFVLAMLMCCCPQGGKAQTTEVFGLKQGVNIGDWLSQKANISFKESDVQMLSGLKYDHIRIPVDESILFNADGRKLYKAPHGCGMGQKIQFKGYCRLAYS